MAYKIDSNVVGLRYCEEASLKTLPGSPVWYPLEPNRFTNFGGKLTTISRKPISQTRQQQKGTVTDLEASGGFEQDLTSNNTLRLLQGFCFADAYEPATTMPLNSAAIDLGAVVASAHTIAATSGLDAFKPGDLVYTSGFGVDANNGLFQVSTGVAALLTVTAGLADEANAPATARIDLVGHQFAAGDITVVMVGGLPRLTSAAVNFTTAFPKIIAGSWIYVGGDATATQLFTGKGFARVRTVAATYLEFDKTDWTAAADDGTSTNAGGTAQTIRIFFGVNVKNESDPTKIKRRTYQLERTLGKDVSNNDMSEYLLGACANEFTVNVKTADKVTTELAFVALDNEQRDGATGVKTGTRPTNIAKDAFNTSSDFSRINLATVVTNNPKPTPLFAFCTDITMKISNNVTANKAIGVLGGFDTTAGNFIVDGKLTAYFADIAGVQAVRDNSDVTMDMAMVKKNAGFVFDIPLITLGNGQATVEQDKPIELPLDMSAAEHPLFHHTIMIVSFAYLPTVAEG